MRRSAHFRHARQVVAEQPIIDRTFCAIAQVSKFGIRWNAERSHHRFKPRRDLLFVLGHRDLRQGCAEEQTTILIAIATFIGVPAEAIIVEIDATRLLRGLVVVSAPAQQDRALSATSRFAGLLRRGHRNNVQRRRLMLVEDDALVRETITLMLEDAFDVSAADRARVAVMAVMVMVA